MSSEIQNESVVENMTLLLLVRVYHLICNEGITMQIVLGSLVSCSQCKKNMIDECNMNPICSSRHVYIHSLLSGGAANQQSIPNELPISLSRD